MNKKKVVIVGGVAAGPKVGSRIVRLEPDMDITLIEKGEFLSYAGCGLPYYVSGVVKEQAELMSTPVGTLRDPVFFQKVKNLHVRNHTEALSIDRENKTVALKQLKTGKTSSLEYDVLVLATGAVPVKPMIPGIDLQNIFSLHGVNDAEGIKDAFRQRNAQDVTIVGGGLIGIEMAEAFSDLGARVTIVEKLPQILPFLDKEISQLVAKYLRTKGVKVKTNTQVVSFEGKEKVEKVVTDKETISSDIVIMAIGVSPNVALAKEAGLEIGSTRAIKVNEKMQTSDPCVYAAGDCVETFNMITGKPCYMPLGSIANRQGRIAANSICGIKDEFPGVVNTAICKIFDYAVATTGLSQRQAIEQGYDIVTVLSPAPDRAHFYPTAKPIMIKLVVDKKTRKLLGAQIIGPGAVDKRIDVSVTAITAGMSVDQIANLDLSYAPPYSAAMDNIITAANIARNKLDGIYESITPEKVKEKMDRGDEFLFLDVRSQGEYETMRIEHATLLPLGKLKEQCEQFSKDKEIITFCKISLRGYEAALILKAHGFKNVKVMDGGVLMWPYELIKK